jgi:hypothetical protein
MARRRLSRKPAVAALALRNKGVRVSDTYQFHKRLSIGVETLHGQREMRDGSDGNVVRFTAGLVYTIFD